MVRSRATYNVPEVLEMHRTLYDICLVFVMLLRLFIAALWLPAWKGLTSWLSFVMLNYVFVTFPCGILSQVWYLIVSIPDLCHLSWFRIHTMKYKDKNRRREKPLIIRLPTLSWQLEYASPYSGPKLTPWKKKQLENIKQEGLRALGRSPGS